MFQLSWSINHGNNNIEDFFTIHDDLPSAKKDCEKLNSETVLHCWSISKIIAASEPHWVDPPAI